jgi:hypothetical protein
MSYTCYECGESFTTGQWYSTTREVSTNRSGMSTSYHLGSKKPWTLNSGRKYYRLKQVVLCEYCNLGFFARLGVTKVTREQWDEDHRLEAEKERAGRASAKSRQTDQLKQSSLRKVLMTDISQLHDKMDAVGYVSENLFFDEVAEAVINTQKVSPSAANIEPADFLSIMQDLERFGVVSKPMHYVLPAAAPEQSQPVYRPKQDYVLPAAVTESREWTPAKKPQKMTSIGTTLFYVLFWSFTAFLLFIGLIVFLFGK